MAPGAVDGLRVGWVRPQPLRDERGVALIMALGVLLVLSIAAAASINYTSTQARHESYDSASLRAEGLAEAGVNAAAAVLNKPTNNALTASLLPFTTTTLDGGTVTWSGTLNQATSIWTITATGRTPNPTGGGTVVRTLTATVRVVPALADTLNSMAWNYIYDWGTGQGCDMTIQQSVDVHSPLYVDGNLCLQNSATISSGPLVVKGQLTMYQSANSVGSSSSPVNEAHIGNGCKYKNNPLHVPCAGATDHVYATILDVTPTPISPPTVLWDTWYQNASPGPKFPCYPASSSPSVTWPTFDNDGVRNDSVVPAWNLTPAMPYDCWTTGGELKWDPAAKVLTTNGTFFIDGSAYISNGAVNTYAGQGTLYLSGTFLLKNSLLCAVSNGSSCDTANWDPNTRLLIVVANGNGDNGLPVGDSAQFVSAIFQGGVYATNTIDIDTTSSVIGPIVGRTVNLGQSTSATFPFIMIVPSGAPGNPNVYAQPGPPIYGG